MNSFDIITFIKELAIIYGSTTISSLVFNKFYYTNRINKAYIESERKLVYKDLSSISNKELEKVKDFCKIEKIVTFLMSVTPVANIPYTINNIKRNQSDYNEFFNLRIDEINKRELEVRKKFLEEMKTTRIIPEDIKEKLQDNDYLPSEEDYLRTKKIKRKTKSMTKEDREEVSKWNI